MKKEKTVLTQNDEEKATVLAEFFNTVFTREPEGEIPNIQVKDVPMMTQIHFTCEDVKLAIDNLKRDKAPGPEGFHPRIIKEAKNEIAWPLQIIFDLSLRQGKLPEDWKTANITAIHKKGDRKDPENYRPVSLTC